MSHIYVLEKALNYIEKHLNDDIDLSIIAREAGYSFYHFQRIFKGVVGDFVKDYIIKRRITEAAKELTHTNKTIISEIVNSIASKEALSN